MTTSTVIEPMGCDHKTAAHKYHGLPMAVFGEVWYDEAKECKNKRYLETILAITF